ncbi:glycosyltransferase family 2 protein [Novosphingobium beihaiensis]|uniref:Glycosyltransferase family 2 protein n=1 Tax=Novosphingobium beihaiensis TaxID=2930389 RepID=A0ABT0BS42_9SPHN|nr:glycosyltransferase family 2 protein [Novosphingobium beihaiensis]MCJ2187469.1 glycosyltransferase family 2 protein [Novosphingobium beihaiensis]
MQIAAAPSSQHTNSDITVIILTYNEQLHIRRAIESVRNIAQSILVIDSYSTDDTVAIAHDAGAEVVQHAFVNQSAQFNWGLDNLNIGTAWVLRLDADEVIESDLASEINQKLPLLPSDIVGVNFDRKHIFMGKWIRHGARYPLRMLRLWRTGKGRVEDRWMDEHVHVWDGRTITFKGGFEDRNENGLSFFIAKHNGYATREAIDVLINRYNLSPSRQRKFHIAARQAKIKRWIKEHIYNHLPLWAGPFAYFLYRYVIRMGFLDGKEGTIYHLLQGFWYRYLVACKIYEFEMELTRCRTTDDKRSALENLTGYKLET